LELVPENELSPVTGVWLNPRTGGALVNDQLKRNASDIFCSNVLHVDGPVDKVILTAQRADFKSQAALFYV
jgi:hypothetical protein